jgi:hypothetical protein
VKSYDVFIYDNTEDELDKRVEEIIRDLKPDLLLVSVMFDKFYF